MDPQWRSPVIFIYALFVVFISANYVTGDSNANLNIVATPQYGRKIPDTLFGIFFEEINHAGAGGIWAELVNNRGFEMGGYNTPSDFHPWDIVGDKSLVTAGTELASLFKRNPVALRIDVNCDGASCPLSGVGVYNPGFWGMNFEDGKSYKLIFYVKSLDSIDITASLTTSDGSIKLGSTEITKPAATVSDWTKVEVELVASGSAPDGRLQLTTRKRGTIWLDQVSLMPVDTFMGHGFRKDLISMVQELKPRFIRYPGGCYVEGVRIWNAFRWSASVGPWEERPGHYGDIWNYWTDDGLGFYEFLQLAEDLNIESIWVINNGFSHNDSIATADIMPWVQDALNSIEFARGDASSNWGKVRAQMGHPEPFPLNYMAIGNEDCGMKNYRGNYMKFYNAIKGKYPDIKLVSNCDGSWKALDHPADLYDFHIYTTATEMFSRKDVFNNTVRSGPKAFVSEYAVWKDDGGKGTLFAALGEAAFLMGLEKNSDVVAMASYAPLFVNENSRTWSPDAIVFNSAQNYGTPSYWMQQYFRDSSGAVLNPSTLRADSSLQIAASAVTYNNTDDKTNYLKIKIVNFGGNTANVQISITGLQNVINAHNSFKTVMTSGAVMDENSFANPTKIVPIKSDFGDANTQMTVQVLPHSLTSYDLQLGEAIVETDKKGKNNKRD